MPLYLLNNRKPSRFNRCVKFFCCEVSEPFSRSTAESYKSKVCRIPHPTHFLGLVMTCGNPIQGCIYYETNLSTCFTNPLLNMLCFICRCCRHCLECSAGRFRRCRLRGQERSIRDVFRRDGGHHNAFCPYGLCVPCAASPYSADIAYTAPGSESAESDCQHFCMLLHAHSFCPLSQHFCALSL